MIYQFFQNRIPLVVLFVISVIFQLFYSIIKIFDLCFFKDLHKQLDEFIAAETKKLQDDNAEDLINKARNGEVDINKIVDSWTKVYSQVSKL